MSAEPAHHLRVVECAGCERLQRALDAARIDLDNANADLTVKRREVEAARNFKAAERKKKRDADLELLKKQDEYGDALKIWEFWRQKCKPNARAFGPELVSLVYARLRDRTPAGELAYSPRYIAEAVLGAAWDPYRDPKGKVHNTLELICRNGAKLEDFHERWERRARKEAA